MDVPFASLKYLLNSETTDPDNPKYEPYGVFVEKFQKVVDLKKEA